MTSSNLLYIYIYTMVHKKMPLYLNHSSHFSWWIFTILLPIETGMNAPCRSYKNYNLLPVPTMSPRYPLKLKWHKQCILKSVVTVFHYSSELWVCEISEQYFIGSVQNVHLVRKFLSQSSSKKKSFTFPQVFNQNFIFKLSMFHLN